MNYYEHHIGDYAQATAHLTFVEDAAYSRLIRKYYAEERPLPADLPAVQRLVGARTREEKSAVKTVLEEFFFLEADGWHNKRADSEIERYREKSSKAAASARARWDKPHSTGNANAMRTHTERNAHQTPDTIHQTPIKNNTRDKPLSCPDGVTPDVWDGFLKVRKAKKAPVTATAIAGIEREARKAGWSLNAALTECCARGWAGFKADWVKTDAEKKMSPYQASVRAAGIAIFGNLEEPQHEQHSTIDITPGTQAPAGLLGSEDL
jgi:uncharacterized protein YdaU (DUF1376 family)